MTPPARVTCRARDWFKRCECDREVGHASEHRCDGTAFFTVGLSTTTGYVARTHGEHSWTGWAPR